MTVSKHIALFAVLSLPLAARAQPTPGTCTRAQAEAYLDHNNVRARIVNTGGLFYRGEPAVYEVPAFEGVTAMFTASIWFGGKVNGQIRTSATLFGEWEMWPGPLKDGAVLPNPDDCSAWDRIWEVTSEDLEALEMSGAISDNLRDWPWELGAPVVDGDGNPDNYDLAAGDRPELIGHQRLWWVMNDVGGEHRSSESDPLGIEVHASAAAAKGPAAIDNSTVYSYRIINRWTERIDSLYLGLMFDPDLGDFSDDQIGADTTIGMPFVFNDDNQDGGSAGYGTAPPALGVPLIRGPLAPADGIDNDHDGRVDEAGERAGFAHMMYGDSDGGIWGDPSTAADFYNYMRGRWKDGRPLTYGGYGYYDYSETPTRVKFPGDPVTGAFWSARNMDSLGTRRHAGDARSYSSFGPISLRPDSSAEFVLAFVWARGKDNLDSITELRRAARAIQDTYDEAIVHAWKPPEKPVVRYENTATRLHPNPASGIATLRYTVSTTAEVRAELFDAWGRRVRTVVGGTREPGEYSERVDLTGLAPGLYLYRMAIGRAEATGSLVVVR